MTAAVKSIFQELDEIDEFFSKDLKYLSNEEYKGLKTILFQNLTRKSRLLFVLPTTNHWKSNYIYYK